MTSTVNAFDDPDLIDLKKLDLDDEQTWLYKTEYSPDDGVSFDTDSYLDDNKLIDENESYRTQQKEIYELLGKRSTGHEKQVFDSRTYTRPKKKPLRSDTQTIQGIDSLNDSLNLSGTKTITKHSKLSRNVKTESDFTTNYLDNKPLRDIVFQDDGTMSPNNLSYTKNENMDEIYTNIDNSYNYIKSNPINIDLSEPANNILNTFRNKFAGSNDHDSFSNISPPSLVSSVLMDGSDTFSCHGSLGFKKETTGISDFVAQNSLCSSMTTSILDEKEMNTSFLSQSGIHGAESFLPNMADSYDFNNINILNNTSHNIYSHKNMHSNLINSGTYSSLFDSGENKLLNDRTKFGMRKSLLHNELGDHELNKYSKHRKHDNSDSLNLTTDMNSKDGMLHNTFSIENTEKPNDNKDTISDAANDSFNKYTARESLSNTYRKNSSSFERVPEKVKTLHDMPQLSEQFSLDNKSDVINTDINLISMTPKRNSTFRKSQFDSRIKRNEEINDYNDEKIDNLDDISDIINTVCKNVNNTNTVEYDFAKPEIPDKKRVNGNNPMRNSNDSLEENNSATSSPLQPTTVPLNLADLEYLAYQPQQSFANETSTPLIGYNKSRVDAFQHSNFSPIHNNANIKKSNNAAYSNKYGTYRVNSSSTGNLNKIIKSHGEVKQLSSVKRESSAPEFVPVELQNNRNNKNLAVTNNKMKKPKGYKSNDDILFAKETACNNQLNQKYSNVPQKSGSINELRSMHSGLPTTKLRQYSSHKELNKIPNLQQSIANKYVSNCPDFRSSNPTLHPLSRQGSYTISQFPTTESQNIKNEIPTAIQYRDMNMIQKPVKSLNPSGQTVNNINRPAVRRSALPRPSSAIPRISSLRPPSTYSIAPRSNNQPDCY